MSTFCSYCDGQFDITLCYRDEIPVCPTCRVAMAPVAFQPSIIPPSLEVIPGKTVNWKEFQIPLFALRSDIGFWDICDHRRNKIEIEPFDPDGTNKQYSMQAEAYWYAARQLEEIIER